MLFVAPLLGLLPNATLAVVVIVYSVGLIQPAEFCAIRQVRTMEFRWAVAAMLGVLLFGTLQGIVVAIIVSLIGLSSQAARPTVHVIGRKRGADVLRPVSPEHPDDETFEGLLILRPEGRLFFANAQSVAEQIQALIAKHQPRVVAIDMSRVPDIEYSALQALIEGEKRTTDAARSSGWRALNPGVLEVVRRTESRAAARPRADAVQRPDGDRALPGTCGPARPRRRDADRGRDLGQGFSVSRQMRTDASPGSDSMRNPRRLARRSIDWFCASTKPSISFMPRRLASSMSAVISAVASRRRRSRRRR